MIYQNIQSHNSLLLHTHQFCLRILERLFIHVTEMHSKKLHTRKQNITKSQKDSSIILSAICSIYSARNHLEILTGAMWDDVRTVLNIKKKFGHIDDQTSTWACRVTYAAVTSSVLIVRLPHRNPLGQSVVSATKSLSQTYTSVVWLTHSWIYQSEDNKQLFKFQRLPSSVRKTSRKPVCLILVRSKRLGHLRSNTLFDWRSPNYCATRPRRS
jgi:hypothetical protein